MTDTHSVEEPVERTMKPMLAACVKQALHLALIDSVLPEPDPNAESFEARAGLWTDQQKAAMEADIYAIPSSALAAMDPGALAQNLACRLFGFGGWALPTPDGPIYTGNATISETFEASFDRPDRSEISEVAFDLLKAMDESENDS